MVLGESATLQAVYSLPLTAPTLQDNVKLAMIVDQRDFIFLSCFEYVLL